MVCQCTASEVSVTADAELVAAITEKQTEPVMTT